MTLIRKLAVCLSLLLCACGAAEKTEDVAEARGMGGTDEVGVAGNAAALPRAGNRPEHGVEYVNASPKLAKVRELRERAYRRIVAGGQGALAPFEYPSNMDDPEWMEDLLEGFDDTEHAVWCYDTSNVLASIYRAAGYHAVSVSFGIEDGLLTHAGTLVRVEGEWFYQDAYFNFEIPVPFFEAVDGVSRGQPLPIAQSADMTRPLRVLTPGAAAFFEDNPKCEPAAGGVFRCDVEFTVEPYISSKLWTETFARQGELGAPADLAGFFLFPFAVFDGKAYQTTAHPILDRYRKAAGCVGGAEPVCSPTERAQAPF